MAKAWTVTQHSCTNRTYHVSVPVGTADAALDRFIGRLTQIEGVKSAVSIENEVVEVHVDTPERRADIEAVAADASSRSLSKVKT